MSLILIDTNDPHVDKHINDILVNEGHAVFQPDEQTPGVLEQNQSQVSGQKKGIIGAKKAIIGAK
mgnify:CR=1 FL=1